MTYNQLQTLWQKKNHGKVADTEHDLQVACVNWFRLTYRNYAHLLFAIPNGGWRNATTAAKLKAEGVVAGVPDLFLAVPSGEFHGLFIEMKNGKAGRLSEYQKQMHETLRNHGYAVETCRDAVQFREIISNYLKH